MRKQGATGGDAPPPQILAECKASPGSGSALHYYLPTQIFRPCLRHPCEKSSKLLERQIWYGDVILKVGF